MIDDWEAFGITAVNGSLHDNNLAMFSPIFFLESWTGGALFDDAVRSAFAREIDTIGTYKARAPIVELLITGDIIESSTQLLGGSDSTLLWDTGL